MDLGNSYIIRRLRVSGYGLPGIDKVMLPHAVRESGRLMVLQVYVGQKDQAFSVQLWRPLRDNQFSLIFSTTMGPFDQPGKKQVSCVRDDNSL